jgi:hypothetical protein
MPNSQLYVKSLMGQRLLIMTALLDGLLPKETHSTLVALHSKEALSCSEVGYWRRQFAKGREYVEDTGRAGFHLSLQNRESFRETSICFSQNSCRRHGQHCRRYSLREVLALQFRHWRWAPHFLPDDRKAERIRQSLLLLTQLHRASARSWGSFGLVMDRSLSR